MNKKLSNILDLFSEFISRRKGLLPLIGALLISLSLIFHYIPVLEWLIRDELLLHLGVIVAIFGFLIAWAL